MHRMKEEWAKDLVVQPWCISQVVKAHEDCPELQAVLDEYHKPVVIQDQVLGELKLDKDYDTFEGEIQWCGKDVLLSLEVNAESKPSWTRARSAAKKLLADCETWDKAMRELAAKNLTELANNWLSQDEENPRNPETDPISEANQSTSPDALTAVVPFTVATTPKMATNALHRNSNSNRTSFSGKSHFSSHMPAGIRINIAAPNTQASKLKEIPGKLNIKATSKLKRTAKIKTPGKRRRQR